MLTRRSVGHALAMAALLFFPVRAGADAVVVNRSMTADTIAEIFVEDDGLRIELEVRGADLGALAPQITAEELENLLRVSNDGARVPLAVRSVERRSRSERDPVSGMPRARGAEEPAEEVLFAVLEAPFSERPTDLRLGTGTVGENRRPSVGFVVYHRGLAVNDFLYLGSDYPLRLDWGDPWYSQLEGPNLQRRYAEPASVFLYVEPYEVRVEIIVRPKDLEHWLDLGIGESDMIPSADRPAIRARVGSFLAKQFELRIDGQPRKPTLDRIHFLRRTLRSSTVIDPAEDIDAVPAVLGAIFVAPTSGLPASASVTWDLWSPRVRRVAAASVDEAGSLPTRLTPEDPSLSWENFLTNPSIPDLVPVEPPPSTWPGTWAARGGVVVAGLLVVLACLFAVRRRPGSVRIAVGIVGGGSLLVLGGVVLTSDHGSTSDTRVEAVAGALLHNVYRAFDHRDEGAVYDVLAKSVHGDLLERLYLETRRGLQLESQGGARVKVKDVAITEVEAKPDADGDGMRARTRWNVSGSVGHWGHVHQRQNRYDAELHLAPRDGVWKLVDIEILQEERVAAP